MSLGVVTPEMLKRKGRQEGGRNIRSKYTPVETPVAQESVLERVEAIKEGQERNGDAQMHAAIMSGLSATSSTQSIPGTTHASIVQKLTQLAQNGNIYKWSSTDTTEKKSHLQRQLQSTNIPWLSAQLVHSTTRTAKPSELSCSEGLRCVACSTIPLGSTEPLTKPFVAWNMKTQKPVTKSTAFHPRCLPCSCALTQQLQLTSLLTRHNWTDLQVNVDGCRVSVDTSPDRDPLLTFPPEEVWNTPHDDYATHFGGVFFVPRIRLFGSRIHRLREYEHILPAGWTIQKGTLLPVPETGGPISTTSSLFCSPRQVKSRGGC